MSSVQRKQVQLFSTQLAALCNFDASQVFSGSSSGSDLTAIQEWIDDAETLHTQMLAAIEDLQNQIDNMGGTETIDLLQTDVDTLQTNTNVLSDSFAGLAAAGGAAAAMASIAESGGILGAMATAIIAAGALGSALGALGTMGDTDEEVAQSLETMRQQVATNTANISTVQSDITQMETDITDAAALGTALENLGTMGTTAADIAQSLESTRQQTNTNTTDIGTLQQNLELAGELISALEEYWQAQASTISTIQSDITTLQSQYTSVYDLAETNSTVIQLISSRVLNLENTQTAQIGSIIAYWGDYNDPAPYTYGYCDGSSYDTTTYSTLYSVLGTSTLPDLRGKFIRGLDITGTIDNQSGRTIGSYQVDQVGYHYHKLFIASGSTSGEYNNTGNVDLLVGDRGGSYSTYNKNNVLWTGTDSIASTETRVKNIALIYIIKMTL